MSLVTECSVGPRGYFAERYAASRRDMAEAVRAELGDRLPAALSPEQVANLLHAVALLRANR